MLNYNIVDNKMWDVMITALKLFFIQTYTNTEIKNFINNSLKLIS